MTFSSVDKFLQIKKGYRVIFVSWENDGDNYKTLTVDGCTEAEAKFYVRFGRLFAYSYHETKYGQHYGNCSHDNWKTYKYSFGEDAEELVAEFAPQIPWLNELNNEFIEERAKVSEDEDDTEVLDYVSDAMTDFMQEVFGTGEDYFFTRVVERITVIDIPVEVTFTDVTAKFIDGPVRRR